MPVHDWTRVGAGIFHDFHTAWITEIRNGLNHGLLPQWYYALTEQHAGRFIPDVLAHCTLHRPSPSRLRVPAPGDWHWPTPHPWFTRRSPRRHRCERGDAAWPSATSAAIGSWRSSSSSRP